MQHPDRREDLVSALRMSTRYVSFLLLPLAFGLFATAKPALTLFVGQAYVQGAEPLMILAGTYAFTSVAAAAGPMLVALGETRLASLSVVLTVAVSVLSAWILAPPFGMLGAATARGVGLIFGTALMIIFLRKKIRLQFDLEGIKKNLIAAIVMAGVVVAVQTQFYSRYLTPVYIITGALVYLLMLRLLKAINPDDIRLIRDYLGPRLTVVSNLLSMVLLPTAE